MSIRKITANFFASLLTPIAVSFRWLPNVVEAIFYQRYIYYDFQITSLGEFLCEVYCRLFLPTSVAALVIIFIPFQVIKDYCIRRGWALTFFKKVGLLSGITLVPIVIYG